MSNDDCPSCGYKKGVSKEIFREICFITEDGKVKSHVDTDSDEDFQLLREASFSDLVQLAYQYHNRSEILRKMALAVMTPEDESDISITVFEIEIGPEPVEEKAAADFIKNLDRLRMN